MNSPLEPETILQDRYLIVETIEQAERYRVYLAEDQQAGGENCILREFVASEVKESVRIHDQFTPIIHQLQSLRHPQLEKFKDFLIQEKNLYLIQSYFEGQDYQTRLLGDSPFTENEAIQLLRQALPALSYLHSQFVIHGDISPSHLLLRSPDGALIFTHFGLLQEIAAQMGIETTETKLLNRVEQFSIIPSGAAQDLYALAVTLLMLLTGKEPQNLFNRQSQSWDWENYRLLSDHLTDVINQMLSVNSTAPSPTADAILALLESPMTVQPPLPPPPLLPTEQFNDDISIQPPSVNRGIRDFLILASVLGVFAVIASFVAIHLRNQNNPFLTTSPTQPLQQPQPTQPTQTLKPTLNPLQAPQSSPVPTNFTDPVFPISPPSSPQVLPPPLQPSTSNNSGTQNPNPVSYQGYCTFLPANNSGRKIVNDPCSITDANDGSYQLIWSNGQEMSMTLNPASIDGNPGQLTYQTPTAATVKTITGRVGFCWNCQAPARTKQPQPQFTYQSPSQPPPKASSSGTNATVSGTPGTKNIRSGAGTAYSVVGTVRTGDHLQILGSSYDRGGYQWYKVYHPQSGTTGWIAAQLISSD